MGRLPPMLRRFGAGRPGLLLLSPLAERGPGDTCSAVVGPVSQYGTEFRMPAIMKSIEVLSNTLKSKVKVLFISTNEVASLQTGTELCLPS